MRVFDKVSRRLLKPLFRTLQRRRQETSSCVLSETDTSCPRRTPQHHPETARTNPSHTTLRHSTTDRPTHPPSDSFNTSTATLSRTPPRTPPKARLHHLSEPLPQALKGLHGPSEHISNLSSPEPGTLRQAPQDTALPRPEGRAFRGLSPVLVKLVQIISLTCPIPPSK